MVIAWSRVHTEICGVFCEFVTHPRKEDLVDIMSQGHVLETHVVLSYLWSVSCKWPVINVTLETLKKSYMKYNTNMFCQKTYINDNNRVYICLSSE